MGDFMADKTQLEILKQGRDIWNSWRLDNPDVKIDFSDAELMGANFRSAEIRGADFTIPNLINADFNFNGADLRAAKLNEANLSGANLSETDLRGANLNGANLAYADLRAAKLNEAVLVRVNLGSANLNEADFGDANLSFSDLTNAGLWETVFTGTIFDNITFGSNILINTIGLESIHHYGPSNVDLNTLKYSKGKIPIDFLRGCGLSDLEIEYAKLAAPGLDAEQVTKITYEIYRLYCDQPIQFYSCFISYSSKDQKFAQRLHDDLQNNGVRCWFAPEDLKIGDEFRRRIGQEIRLRDKLLIILSKNSVGSEWVGDEVEKALAEERDAKALKLFPIRLDGAVLKSKDDWAEKIRLRRHIGVFSGWKDEGKYKVAFERLLKDLKAG
jgi:uncharacterized protein YjbI with pentapeptide repeats